MANQLNEKIIKKFKALNTNTRRQLHVFVKAMCEEAKGGEVRDILLGKGMAPCVAREWGNEHRKRDSLLKRALDQKYRKETSTFGKRGDYGRRIIKSDIYVSSFLPNGQVIQRMIEFHATKGRRNHRITA